MTASSAPDHGHTDLITIVVPVYNTEMYLAQCLDSILQQEHSNLEVICVDDCTPDASADLVRDYIAKDPRVRLITHEYNQGLGPARNTGIKDAKGDLIGFVDSDDWIEPQMFRALLNLMKKEDADIVQCSAGRIADGKFSGSYPNASGSRSSNIIHSMFGDSPTFVGAAWNKLYKRKLFIDHDIFYPPVLFEDVATTPRLLWQAKKIASIPQPYLNYRFRSDSIVNSVKIETLLKRIEGLFDGAEILYNYSKKNDLHSFEFIMNYRKYMRSQLEQNVRLSKANERPDLMVGPCLEKLEYYLHGSHEHVDYYFPDKVGVMKYLENFAKN